ncbi:MAG: hypothetical protein Q7S20_05960 [Gemmatimonadaceae bacterium]|nr:hypothetical protein [Gemmatimonadaceae bacterium]
MARHQAYFDTLAADEQDSVSWASALAGLAVLRLVDAVRMDADLIRTDWTGVCAVVDAVTALGEGNRMRRPLMKVMDQLRDDHQDWGAIGKHVFDYGRTLDLEGNWGLAVDVFGMVADIARAARKPELAMQATTALGGAARRSGDWDRSADGYAEAAHMADALGDKASGLTVRVGTANTLLARGNLPASQLILDDVISESAKSGLDGVAALALHTSASIAHLRGNFAEAVSIGYEALNKATNPSAKDTILSDIAASFIELGMHDAARDANLVISLTSRYQWVRWQATINLMDLAARDGMEEAFFDYADQLRYAALDPRLRSYFLLYYGQGCVRCGREEEGRHQIAEAQRFATRQKIHQVAFDAEKVLASLAGERKSRPAEPVQPRSDPVPDGALQVAEALTYIRKTALSSPQAGDWM